MIRVRAVPVRSIRSAAVEISKESMSIEKGCRDAAALKFTLNFFRVKNAEAFLQSVNTDINPVPGTSGT